MNDAVANIDLTDTEPFVTGEAHSVLRRLRADSPVHWNRTKDGGFWALSRYADVLAAYRDQETFSSAEGAIMGGSYRRRADTASGRMLVASDPPQHRRLRRAVQRVLSQRMVERVSMQVQQNVSEAVDTFWKNGGGDFAEDIAMELPTSAVMAMFAIGRDDARYLLKLTRAMIAYRDESYSNGIPEEALRLAAAQFEILEFFLELVAKRRIGPGDDAVSLLLFPSGEPGPDEDTLLFNLMNLAVGGNETTPHSASGGVLALAERPEQWDKLRNSPDLLATAVEEVLRWTSTNAYVQRVVTRRVRIREIDIAEGEVVTLWNCSANRDDEYFRDPDQFDISRKPNPHISFGSGIHHCIGAIAARRELTALLSALRGKPGRLVMSGEPIRLRSNFMLGIKRLPVEVVGR